MADTPTTQDVSPDRNKVFEYLHQTAANFPDIAAKYNAMDKAGQENFIKDAYAKIPELGKITSGPKAPASQDPGVKGLFPDAYQPGMKGSDALRLASNAATFGQQPRISAATESLISNKPYSQALNENQQKIDQIRKENPVGAPLIELPISAAVTAPLAGGGFLGSIGKGAGIGSAYASGQQDLTTSQGLKNTGKGAVVGGILAGIGKGLSVIGDQADKAGLNVLKLDAPTLRRLEIKGDVLGKAEEISKAMMDEGIINNPSTADAMEKKTFSLMQKTGKTLGDGYTQLDQAAPEGLITKRGIKDQILSQVQKQNPLMDDQLLEKTGKELDQLLNKTQGVTKSSQYDSKTKLGFNDLWNLVKEIDDKTRIYERASDPAYETMAQSLNDVAGEIRGFLSNASQEVSPDIASVIDPSSKLYAQASIARKALADTVRRGVQQNKAIAGPGFVDRVVSKTIGATPILGAKAGLYNLISKTPTQGLAAAAIQSAVRAGE